MTDRERSLVQGLLQSKGGDRRGALSQGYGWYRRGVNNDRVGQEWTEGVTGFGDLRLTLKNFFLSRSGPRGPKVVNKGGHRSNREKMGD